MEKLPTGSVDASETRSLGPRLTHLLLIPMLAALTMAGVACRPDIIADEPGAFTFRGQPVHPAAVAALYRSPQGIVDLTAFPESGRPGFHAWEDQPGWWIVEYDEDLTTGKIPFFAYAAFTGPDTGGVETYILSVTFDDGRTGDVDNLILLQKSANSLYLIGSWEEGSACRGGIFAQRLEGENFLYSRDLTPIDMLELASGIDLELEAHTDLEAMADSCYASANFIFRIAQGHEELVSVRLYDEPKPDEKGRTEGFRYQTCFNRLFNSYLTEGRTVLTPADLDEFARRFRDECFQPSAPLGPRD
jgi:hypothetical protein